MADRAEWLEVWTVATFNVVAFGLVLVTAGHVTGALADVLPGVGTLPGLSLFGYLWGLAVAATRWALAAGGLERSASGDLPSLLVRGGGGGALIGAGFVVGIALVGGAIGVLSGRLELIQVALVILLGGLVSAVVGSLVGVLFVLVDVSVYRTTRLVL